MCKIKEVTAGAPVQTMLHPVGASSQRGARVEILE